ncbi:hypothetical protein AAW14_31970 [Streptomyces hygroscopicus]|uniref:hypothetical protein n=1 Tax=Streptomyces hygroscopicus TaxID=1912 RepID=UPI00223F6B14|nr:hypothetical protein [Streptomyces hygroscopicus]MCW7946483.1 hypothetical protein [Streptomyces hygroscopicus]
MSGQALLRPARAVARFLQGNGNALLQESGNALLQESGSRLLLEAAVAADRSSGLGLGGLPPGEQGGGLDRTDHCGDAAWGGHLLHPGGGEALRIPSSLQRD